MTDIDWKARAEKLERQRDELRAAIFGGENYEPNLRNGQFVEMARTTEEARKGGLARAEAAEAENTHLRAALAQSELPCVYCSLPRDKWEKCESGFPGCARADDAMGCPELGARMRLEAAEARVTWLEEQISHYKEDLRVQKASHEVRVRELESRLTITDEMAEKAAVRDVLAERHRQISAEGWTPEHDDTHLAGEMANAAACYARNAFHDSHFRDDGTPVGWPWSKEWWKPKGARRDLVRAAALIIAEIERLDRAALTAVLENHYD